MITACAGGGNSSKDNSNSQTSGNSQGGDSSLVVKNDGSLDKPYTAAEIKALCEKAGDGVIVDNKELYVTGTFDAGTTVNAQYGEYYGYLDQNTFHISGAKLADGLTAGTTDGALDGKKVVVKGYAELYQGDFKMGYLPKTASPTGEKYTPTIVKIEGGTGGNQGNSSTTGGTTSQGGNSQQQGGSGFAGANASETGNVATNAKTLVFDFDAGVSTVSGLSNTSSSSPSGEGTMTANKYEFAYNKAIIHDASNYIGNGYFGLCKEGAYVANKTAIPGKIQKVEIEMPTEKSNGSVSALAKAVCDFGTSQLGRTSATNGQNGGSGAKLAAYSTIEGSYFAISGMPGTNNKGESAWYNFYITRITVTYVD